jgi:hypothetical protein
VLLAQGKSHIRALGGSQRRGGLEVHCCLRLPWAPGKPTDLSLLVVGLRSSNEISISWH